MMDVGLAKVAKGAGSSKRRASGSLGAPKKRQVQNKTQAPQERDGTSPAMAKWTTRSKSWVFTCMGPNEATMAGQAFRKAAKEDENIGWMLLCLCGWLGIKLSSHGHNLL